MIGGNKSGGWRLALVLALNKKQELYLSGCLKIKDKINIISFYWGSFIFKFNF